MKLGKLSSFAFVLFIGLGTSHAFAQDHDPGIAPPSHDSQIPVIEQSHLNFTVRSAALDGGSTTFDVNRSTGAYTVETSGGMAHFIELNSQGKLSSAQMKSIEKALATAQAADAPAQMPGALVEGAPEFTLAWNVEGGKGGSISGPNNPNAATEGQSKKVKALWDAVTPLLDKMSKLQESLVKDHPYVPNIKTVEDDAAKSGKDSVKPVDLGHLDKPGTEFEKAAAKAGLIADGGLLLKPGQAVTFTTDRNQINGIASITASSPDVTITSKVVKAMNPGQDGDEQNVEWTIALSPKATAATTAEITASGDYQARNDPAYNFKIGVATQPTTSATDGVTDAIRNRGKTGDVEAPRTGMDRLIDDKMGDNQHPERAAEDK